MIVKMNDLITVGFIYFLYTFQILFDKNLIFSTDLTQISPVKNSLVMRVVSASACISPNTSKVKIEACLENCFCRIVPL